MARRSFKKAILLLAAIGSPAGAIPARFSITPPTEARIILRGHFRVCKLKNVDPWSEKCPNWELIKPKMDLKGSYCIFAQWGPDRRYQGAANYAAGDSPVVLEIRPREYHGSLCS